MATAGLLEQNDELRQRVQMEEREKAKLILEQELAAERLRLKEETQNIMGTVQAQMQEEMSALKEKLAETQIELQNFMKLSEELNNTKDRLTEDLEVIEYKLADADGAKEMLQIELDAAQKNIIELKEDLAQTCVKLHTSDTEKDKLKLMLKETEVEIASYRSQIRVQGEFEEKDTRFAMFTDMMDFFEDEKKQMNEKRRELEALLATATQDIMYLHRENLQLKR